MLNNVMEKLGSDMPGAKAILNNLATTHKTKGITKEQFVVCAFIAVNLCTISKSLHHLQQFREALVELLAKLGLGSNLAAWNATIDMMFHIVFNGLDGTPV
jgi:hypothetical protein